VFRELRLAAGDFVPEAQDAALEAPAAPDGTERPGGT